MNESVAQAVAMVQDLFLHYESRNFFLAERCDEALNDLVRSPYRTGEPLDLVRGAMSNARKKLRRRGLLAPSEPATQTLARLEPLGGLGIVVDEPRATEIISLSWYAALSGRDRELIALDVLGFTPGEVAEALELAPGQLYVQASRARTRARALLLAAA